MAALETVINISNINKERSKLTEETAFVSNIMMQITQFVNYAILCGLVSCLGTVANVINMVVFFRQGLKTTINISLFAMALSDLCSLILQQCCNIFFNPFFENSDVPMVSSEIQYITASVPRESFSRITCLITVYVAADRCLCIAFPLHVKQMITPRRTTAVIIVIYIGTWIS